MNAGASAPIARSVSVVIEWENASRIGSGRALRMLTALRDQMAALPGPFELLELLFVHGGSAAESEAVGQTAGAAGLQLPWRSVGSRDGSYAGQKRYGAGLAAGEILVILDSDVVPQPGWLEGLLTPFADDRTEIVCGETFVEYWDFYSATMALGWLFPLRRHETGLVETDWFQANNFAIRRDIFTALPEAACGGLRDGTIRMVEMLRERGHRILLNRSAAVAHPPPEGIRGFVVRALWSGYDNALRWKRRGSLWRGVATLVRDLFGVWVRVARHHRGVGFGPLKAAAAACLLSIYYVLRLAGYAAALLAPETARRRLEAADTGRLG